MTMKPLLLYTMTSGLGDYLIMGDLMRKIEESVHGARCLMAHRANPHIRLWPYGSTNKSFFNVYNCKELLALVNSLKKARTDGYTTFGLQMAPGSVQGFFFHLFLKRLKAIDFIVDFNLINADILTPPEGKYILDMHLNQARRLLNTKLPERLYKLELPVNFKKSPADSSSKLKDRSTVGIHPWSRRGDQPCFVWPDENWTALIRRITQRDSTHVIVFGRDKRFDEFRHLISEQTGNTKNISFIPSRSVPHLIETINSIDHLISVNTSVIHIGYSLEKPMTVLSGPSLDLWIPEAENIEVIRDKAAIFPGSDKMIDDRRFPCISRIPLEEIIK